MKHYRHIALLLAGGNGRRMKATRPKQYMDVDGESILLHTMRAFQRHPLIDEIYVVCAEEWKITVQEEAANGGISKFAAGITGGETPYQSLTNGIRFLQQHMAEAAQTIVLVHDSVRPLISQDIISRNIAVCLTHGNAITALASHEAFLISKDGKTSEDYLPREGVFRAQTPHTFPLSTLIEIADEAEAQGICRSQSLYTLANQLKKYPLHLAQGDLMNFKLTVPEDILVYQALRELMK